MNQEATTTATLPELCHFVGIRKLTLLNQEAVLIATNTRNMTSVICKGKIHTSHTSSLPVQLHSKVKSHTIPLISKTQIISRSELQDLLGNVVF